MLAISMVLSRLAEIQKNTDEAKGLMENITPENLSKVSDALDRIGDAKDLAKSSVKNIKNISATLEATNTNDEVKQKEQEQSMQQEHYK